MNYKNTKVKAWINLLAFIVTIIFNVLGSMGIINGMSQKAVSNKYHTLITPAPLTFSIWGVIYTLVLVVLVWMIIKEKEIRVKKLISVFTPSFLSISIFNIVWIILFSYEKIALSTIAIIGLLISLINLNKKLLNHRNEIPFKLASITFGLYAGWLNIATVVNISAFLVSIDWNGFGISPTIWAPITVILSVLIVIAINNKLKNSVYNLPVAWAFFGILLEIERLNHQYDYGAILKHVLVISIITLILIAVRIFKNNDYCVLPKE